MIGLRLAAAAVRKNQFLYLRYRLEGPLEELLIPEYKPLGVRKNNLWQNTCFEAFWAEAHSTTYWEL
ncbi:DOMON domain-containing protein, partial [Synechococcus sp.]